MAEIDKLTKILLTIKKRTEEIRKESRPRHLEPGDSKNKWKRKEVECATEKNETEARIKVLETKKHQSGELIERIKQEKRKKEHSFKGRRLTMWKDTKTSSRTSNKTNFTAGRKNRGGIWIRATKRGRLLVAKKKNLTGKRNNAGKKSN
ncbi:hypothetical protein KM043_015775 [Ampulex compressa]|nr:hypothetical protein KM043_015775 [Ampulex compressa]